MKQDIKEKLKSNIRSISVASNLVIFHKGRKANILQRTSLWKKMKKFCQSGKNKIITKMNV